MVLFLFVFRCRESGCHTGINDIGGSCPKSLDISGKISRQGDDRIRRNGVVNAFQTVQGEALRKSARIPDLEPVGTKRISFQLTKPILFANPYTSVTLRLLHAAQPQPEWMLPDGSAVLPAPPSCG